MTVGEKIRARRLELGLTMEELGAAIGVQRSAINKYEKGYVELRQSTIAALAQALHVSVLYFLDDDAPDLDRRILDAWHRADAGTRAAVCKLLDIDREEHI